MMDAHYSRQIIVYNSPQGKEGAIMINFSRHYTSEQIIKAIADYDSVSFDVFDSLVKRSVAVPSDVFARTAQDYCVNYGMGGGGAKLY